VSGPGGLGRSIGPGWRAWPGLARLGLSLLRDPNRVRLAQQGREFLPQVREYPADDVLDLPVPPALAAADTVALTADENVEARTVEDLTVEDLAQAADQTLAEAADQTLAEVAEIDGADEDGSGWP
jgi:hypothetical protein